MKLITLGVIVCVLLISGCVDEGSDEQHLDPADKWLIKNPYEETNMTWDEVEEALGNTGFGDSSDIKEGDRDISFDEQGVEWDPYTEPDYLEVDDSCTPRVERFRPLPDIDIIFEVEFLGMEEGDCHVKQTIVEESQGFGFLGQSMTCRFATGDAPRNDYLDACDGELAESILELTRGVY